jgi:hypothetical protein
MIDKVDISSDQCQMSPRGPKSMRKANGLSLIVIAFIFQRSHHVSVALRPRCSFLRTYPLFAVCHIIYRYHQERDLDRHQVFGAYHVYTVVPQVINVYDFI